MPGMRTKLSTQHEIFKVNFMAIWQLIKLKIPFWGSLARQIENLSGHYLGHLTGLVVHFETGQGFASICELLITPCTVRRATRSRAQVFRAPYQLVPCHLFPPVDTRPPTETNSLLIGCVDVGF